MLFSCFKRGCSKIRLNVPYLFLMLAILEAYMRVLAVSSASLSRGERVQTATVNEDPPRASRSSLDKRESW